MTSKRLNSHGLTAFMCGHTCERVFGSHVYNLFVEVHPRPLIRFFCAGDDFFEVICGPLTPLLFFPIAFSVNLKKIMKFVETIQRKKGDTIRRTFSVLKDIDLT